MIEPNLEPNENAEKNDTILTTDLDSSSDPKQIYKNSAENFEMKLEDAGSEASTMESGSKETKMEGATSEAPKVEPENKETVEETKVEEIEMKGTTSEAPKVEPENRETVEETKMEGTSSEAPKVEPENRETVEETKMEDTSSEAPKVEPESKETVEETKMEDTNSEAPKVEPESKETVEETKMEDTSNEAPKVEPESKEISTAPNEIEEIEEIEDEVTDLSHIEQDVSSYSKKDFVDLADRLLEVLKGRNIAVSDVRNVDNAVKIIRPAFDELVNEEKKTAKSQYITQNGNDEGFEYKNDNYSLRFEGSLVQIKEKRQAFYQRIEQEKEDYFETKTRLLQKLREIVEEEEKGESKNNWEAFKQLQQDWKNAGNINSPHNGSLWSAYNALVDRYFDIRSIQNELKELDRKKNIEAKGAIVAKIVEISENIENHPLTNVTLKIANDLLAEYKHIGPGSREEQETLWNKLKSAFDKIYDKKRSLTTENQQLAEEIYKAKTQLLENLKPYLEFQSDSINEWNTKSKEVIHIQEQWNNIKGSMSKEKAKEVSKEFWHTLKAFFRNKSDFFARLEARREENLAAKQALVDEIKTILESGDTSAPNTNKVIQLQKKWKNIGHVPEKYKDSVYEEFKNAADAYFNQKREENKAHDEEYDQNLKAKLVIIEKIEKLAKSGDHDFSTLSELKKEFNTVGFVPRKEIGNVQKKYIDAVNSFVKSTSGLNSEEKDKLIFQNQVEVALNTGGSSKSLNKQEYDIRRKIKTLEDEISLTRNNLEFFGHSKNSEKLKADYLKKVDTAVKELKELKSKLKLIESAQ